TQYSAHFPFVPGQMAAQPEMVEARHSALSTQHSALSTQHSALGLSTQHFLCNPKIGEFPGEARTVVQGVNVTSIPLNVRYQSAPPAQTGPQNRITCVFHFELRTHRLFAEQFVDSRFDRSAGQNIPSRTVPNFTPNMSPEKLVKAN